MKSESPTCRLLILFIILLVSLTTGELEFYQDIEPDAAEDVSFKALKRILEFENNQHELHRSREIHHTYPIAHEDYLPQYSSDKQKTIFEILLENPRILEMMQKNKLRNIHYQQRPEYDDVNEYPRSIVERERHYVNFESPSKSYEYPKVNIPYPESNANDKMYFSHGSHVPARMVHPNWKNFETNMADNTLIRLNNKVIDPPGSKLTDGMEDNPVPGSSENWDQPEFSYKFDEPSIDTRDTFAITPNDPHYYENEILSNSRTDKQTISNDNHLDTTVIQNTKKIMDMDNSKIHFNLDEREATNTKISNLRDTMPELQRRTDQESAVATSTSYKLSNDMYFIAIVAGCSAAAMFALVLITLTWCRLHRGAKAAADIDYPAYGVTGPNKDISPSGDQRLAHSAQMYHFQHQKQQIIAMEKSTAAREPGSVSEAESDEENEEGDYTVYECPGLAPAGEMEVKNPLFHDDPTPTTPSQNHTDMDHSRQQRG